jgi:hypothetical protein
MTTRPKSQLRTYVRKNCHRPTRPKNEKSNTPEKHDPNKCSEKSPAATRPKNQNQDTPEKPKTRHARNAAPEQMFAKIGRKSGHAQNGPKTALDGLNPLECINTPTHARNPRHGEIR